MLTSLDKNYNSLFATDLFMEMLKRRRFLIIFKSLSTTIAKMKIKKLSVLKHFMKQEFFNENRSRRIIYSAK
jgi:hypothetical protein